MTLRGSIIRGSYVRWVDVGRGGRRWASWSRKLVCALPHGRMVMMALRRLCVGLRV